MTLLTDACGPECIALLARQNGERRHMFAIEYSKDCDLMRAYEDAGYTGTTRQSRNDVLTHPDTQAAIRRHRLPALQAAADRATEFREMIWKSLKANVFELYVAQSPTSRARRHLVQVIKKGIEDRDYVPPAPDATSKNREAIDAAAELLRSGDILGAMSMLDEIAEDLGSKGWRPPSEKELQRAIDDAAQIRAKRPDEIPIELQVLIDRVKIDRSRGHIEYWVDRSANKALWAKITGMIEHRITIEQARAVGREPLEKLREVLPELLEAVEEDRRRATGDPGLSKLAHARKDPDTGLLILSEQEIKDLLTPEAGAVVAWVQRVATSALHQAEERGDPAWVEKWGAVLKMQDVGLREIMMAVVWRCGA